MNRTPPILTALLTLSTFACDTAPGDDHDRLNTTDLSPQADVSDLQFFGEVEENDIPIFSFTPETEDQFGDDVLGSWQGSVPECTGNIFEGYDLAKSVGPDVNSNAYSVPSLAEEDALAQSLAWFSINGWSQAVESAQDAEYSFCMNDEFAKWQPVHPELGGAFILVRRATESPWALSVPHPVDDIGTVDEALSVFAQTRARMLIISGTQRCANIQATGCDGVSEACTASPQGYRESDMAHIVEGHFQRAHLLLARIYPETTFVSMHGMSESGASISDGTGLTTSSDSLVAKFTNDLQVRLSDQQITSCNDYAGAQVRKLLCGTNNTQGRALNESPFACTVSAPTATGRFIHLEQSPQVRAEASAVALALIAAASDAI